MKLRCNIATSQLTSPKEFSFCFLEDKFKQFFFQITNHDEPEEWLLGIPTDSHQIDEVSEQTRDVSILFGCLGG